MGAWGLGYCDAYVLRVVAFFAWCGWLTYILPSLGVTLDANAFAPPETTSLLSSSFTSLSVTATATISAKTSALVTTSPHTLTTGASIGIGVGAAIAGMVIFMGLVLLGWKLLRRRRRREESRTQVRVELTGTGKPAEMAAADRIWHPEELPTGVGGESGM
jgi:hypothetical protein